MDRKEINLEGKIVDIHNRRIIEGSVCVEGGRIKNIDEHPTDERSFILPGFVDAHVHIESSMLTPEEFGRAVVRQGTVGVVTDPHEIANVMGLEGIEFMLTNAGRSPVKLFFTIPSCVPATAFDSPGATISSADVEALAASGRFHALSEMMNVPGVLFKDNEVISKIAAAQNHGLPVDGHCPKLGGDGLRDYTAAGISTDHECASAEEALEKIAAGMSVMIREGSAARNYEALSRLIPTNPGSLMFCTDDAHPKEFLERGHIRDLVVRSIAKGFDLFDALRIASLNPVEHYKLDIGLLRPGDKADFVVVDNLTDFTVKEVYIDGTACLTASKSSDLGSGNLCHEVNSFFHDPISPETLVKSVGGEIPIISLIDGELLTELDSYAPERPIPNLESDIEKDVLKLVYINRYHNGTPQVSYCKGFGLQRGAFACSVAHDSHNILAVGCSDKDIFAAVNAVIAAKGGVAAASEEQSIVLPLPVGGLMSPLPAEEVMSLHDAVELRIKDYGCKLYAPLMTLSFLSLLVIPEVKLGEKGLFSYSAFDWIGE